jgi:hypothetical protein
MMKKPFNHRPDRNLMSTKNCTNCCLIRIQLILFFYCFCLRTSLTNEAIDYVRCVHPESCISCSNWKSIQILLLHIVLHLDPFHCMNPCTVTPSHSISKVTLNLTSRPCWLLKPRQGGPRSVAFRTLRWRWNNHDSALHMLLVSPTVIRRFYYPWVDTTRRAGITKPCRVGYQVLTW